MYAHNPIAPGSRFASSSTLQRKELTVPPEYSVRLPKARVYRITMQSVLCQVGYGTTGPIHMCSASHSDGVQFSRARVKELFLLRARVRGFLQE
jgi:hypothetical protein